MSHLLHSLNFPLYRQQFQWMVDLTNCRLDWLTPFFRFLNYFDSPYFFFLLIPVVWFGFSYQWGIRLFYWANFNSLINSLAKSSFGWPRPSTDYAPLGLYHPKSFGFPSCAAQTSLFLAILLLTYWKTPHTVKKWILAISYVFLISFSRLYLGVHYPIDILGGWAFGLLTAILCIQMRKPLEEFLIKQPLFNRLILSQLIPLLVILFVPYLSFFMGSIMGVGIGIYFSLKHHLFLAPPKHLAQAIARSFFAITTLFVLYFLWSSPTETFFRSFVLSLFMALAVSPLYKRLFA